MPTSPAKLAANRRNAQRSTGPRTHEGKRKVSQNASKHGLRSRDLALTSFVEPKALFDEMRTLYLEIRPKSAQEQVALSVIAVYNVQLRAIANLEQTICNEFGADRLDLLTKLTRMAAKVDRDLFAAHQQYRAITNQQSQPFTTKF